MSASTLKGLRNLGDGETDDEKSLNPSLPSGVSQQVNPLSFTIASNSALHQAAALPQKQEQLPNTPSATSIEQPAAAPLRDTIPDTLLQDTQEQAIRNHNWEPPGALGSSRTPRGPGNLLELPRAARGSQLWSWIVAGSLRGPLRDSCTDFGCKAAAAIASEWRNSGLVS